MDAISRLGLDMDTSGLARGAQASDRLAASMDRAEREAGQLENRTKRMQGQFSVLGDLANGLGRQLAAAFSVWAVIRANDAWVGATNQLRLVTETARELRDVTQDVFNLSQRTAARFEGTAALFASIQRATNLANSDVLRLTETINKLAAAGGGPEGSRNSALFQLRQLFQGVNVQAQEFNSLIDGTPLLVQAIADSLGVTRRELRQMVLDQELTSAAVIEALQEQADEADALFARVAFTMGDAFVRIQNAFQKLVGTNLGPVFSRLVDGISFLAEHLDSLIPILSGVAVAFAVAFAPSVVLAFAGAVQSLFRVMAAHPFAAIAGGVTAALLAMQQFGDALVVGQARVADFTKAVNDEMREALDATADVVDVTLRDVIDALFLELRDAGATFAEEAGRIMAETAEAVSGGAIQAEPFWTDWAESIIRTGNIVIGVQRTMWDAARIYLPRVGDIIAVEVTRGANEAIEAIETVLNAMRRLQDPLGLQPDIVLPRLEAPAEAMERMAAAGQEFTAAMRENFSRDWIGEMLEGVMDRARSLAVARAAAAAQAGAEADANAAAAAAAEAAAANAAKVRAQLDARQALFDELYAQIRLNEREFEIWQETEELLRRFPDYYRSIAAGAEDVAAAAREAAEEDARSLDALRRKVAVLASLRTMAADALREQRLIEAAGQSADELAIVERTLDLLEEHADLYESMGKDAEAVARADAERQLRNERILDVLTRQAERARDLARAPAENLMEGLERAGDDFWDNFLDRGFEAFDDLGDALKDVFRRLQADILRAVFDPMIAGIRNAITGAVQGAGAGGGGGSGSVFANIGQVFGLGRSGGGGFNLGSLGNIGLSLAAAAGFGSSNALGLGLLNGGGGLGLLAANGLNALGLPTLGASAGNLLNGIFTPGNAMGGFVGSGLASLLGFDGKNAGIGGTVGGLIGSIGGPIGSAIGSFIGQTLGSLIGPNPTANDTWGFISRSGEMGPIHGRPTEETKAALLGVHDQVKQGIALIEQLGGVSSAYISSLHISGSKHQSAYRLTDLATGRFIGGDAEGDRYTGTIGDPNDLVRDALGGLLTQTTFENPVLQAVKSTMQGAGKGFEEILEVLGKLSDVLPDNGEQLSQWGQALKQLTQTFDDLRASTAGVAAATQQIEQAFAEAKAALRDQFSDGIEDAILSIESPVTLQFEKLLEAQAQRLADANALGADVTRVMHLNELELKGFIEQAGGSAQAFASLNSVFEELIAKAQAAGNATQPLIDAYAQARAGVTSAFDDSIAQQMANLANPTLGALKALLDAQKARLEQARAIGANIVAVERLNAMEQQAFFENLSDAQRQDLAAHLGLIEDFTGRIAVVLAQLNDELDMRIDQTEAMRTDLLRQSDAMRDLARNLSETRQGITDRYGPATPMAAVEELRERFAELAEQSRAGNDSALNAIGQVGQQLIEASRALYGNTTTFRGDYDLVTAILQEAETLAGGRADALQSEAQTLIEQRDLLIAIRDLLSEPDPALDILSQRLVELDANQDVVAGLLAQYLQFQAQQAGQNFNLSQLHQDATLAAQTPSLSGTQSLTTSAPGATNQQANTITNPGAGTQTQPAANDAAAQLAAVQIDVLQTGFQNLSNENQELRREIRTLNQRLSFRSVGLDLQ